MRGETSCNRGNANNVWFQSTLLMRGETLGYFIIRSNTINFNPLSSCEERRSARRWFYDKFKFQSTLLMRGETNSTNDSIKPVRFQSTLLMRGETVSLTSFGCPLFISIHSPHARRDYFWSLALNSSMLFQSTLLMRGETIFRGLHFESGVISIHSPHARRDNGYTAPLS